MSTGWFALFVALGVLTVVIAAWVLRNRLFATFVGILLTVQGLVSIGLIDHFSVIWPAWVYLQLCVFLHFVSLVRARMRPTWWRALVSIPGLFFGAATLLAFPFAIVAAFGVEPWGASLGFAAAALGLVQSLHTPETEVDVALDGKPMPDGPRRHELGEPGESRPLTIVQITDPHLGPFMSVARLQRICERAVEREPDLILLTGDFLTMESQADPKVLSDSLAPLAAYAGKTFACFGNHDHEAPALVREVLAEHDIHLLMDDEAVVETPAGPVQIIGSDFHFRDRRARLQALCEKFPRRDGHLRLVLLHDPGAFRHLPEGHGDLVLSGHTHGGQVGLLTLGLRSTVVSAVTSIPDHGMWARGEDRLYVHRGTGVYGFPLRVGVPGEQSLLRVHDRR